VFDLPADKTVPFEARKGKGRVKEVPRQFFLQERKDVMPILDRGKQQQSAWWLEVASPTWDDMRALGKVCLTYRYSIKTN
jgi:hypothetical protein